MLTGCAPGKPELRQPQQRTISLTYVKRPWSTIRLYKSATCIRIRTRVESFK